MTEKKGGYFGVPLQIPSSWEDESVYRFVIPSDELRGDLDGGLLVAQQKPGFRASIVRVDLDGPLEQVFEPQNEELRRQDPSFASVAHGGGQHAGAPLVWQDVRRNTPDALQLFQRQVAMSTSDGTGIVLTISSAVPNLDAVARAVGLVELTEASSPS